MSKAKFIAVVCLCCMIVTAAASDAAATGKNIYERAVTTARSEIWRAMNSGKCGSAAVAIMVNGRIVYSEGFGMADREKSIPVTSSTLFNIGSISKVYAAAAIMLLVDDGKVGLDRPVKDYLPEFWMADGRYRKITVRMLLDHQSGLPGTNYSNAFGFEYDDFKKQQTIDTLFRSRLKHDPGANAVYCNDGFTLAEMIVERVSGSRYINFLDKRIFKRLGLKNTGMGVGTITGKPVALHYVTGTGKRYPLESSSVLAAGGLSSTAIDLCRFADTFSTANKLFKKDSLAEMRKAQPSAFQDKLRNPMFSGGLGWDLTGLPRYDAAGIRLLGKGGRTGDYSSFLFTVPDERISVAVTATGAQTDAVGIALDILDALLVDKKLISSEEKPLFIPPTAQKLPKGQDSFGGYYAGDEFCQVVFDKDKDSVTVYSFKEKEKIPAMTLVYNNGYYYDKKGNRYYFTLTGGESYLVSYQPAFRTDKITMQKIKPVEKPQRLRIDMDGRAWLRRNVSPFEVAMLLGTHLEKSLLYKDLPGYISFQGVKRINSPEFAGMSFDAIRDQTELTLLDKNGNTWAWLSDMLYSPAESAAPLKVGENSIRIARDGYSEWLAVNDNMVLNFTKPARGRILVFSADDTLTYDSEVNTDGVYAAKGSYVECAGHAGDSFTVRAEPVSAGEKKQ